MEPIKDAVEMPEQANPKPRQLTLNGKKGNNLSLIKAKKELDKALVHLDGYPEFYENVRALRDQLLSHFFEEERKIP